MEQAAYIMRLESETETYEQLIQRFFHYMQTTLAYYLSIYKEEAFEGEMEMLPPEAKAAVWLNQMFSREEEDWDGKLADLKECVGCYPSLRNNIKRLVCFIGDKKQEAAAEAAQWELLQMVEMMKEKIRLLAEQGLTEEASAICAQVHTLAPKDCELVRLQEELTGIADHKKILLSVSILCSGRSKTTLKCLESLEKIRSSIPMELIVVDTGCDAKLHSRLANYADVITRFTWCDDFSAARNAGLRLARGEWFLYLDDDEWFVEVDELIDFFVSGTYKEYAAAQYIQRNFLDKNGTQYTDCWVTRMIRLEKDTCFQCRIHEYLTPIRGKEMPIHAVAEHYGYVYETKEALLAHYERNSSLLKEMIAEEPQEFRWYMLLAQEYRTAEQWQKLYDLGEQGIALANKRSASFAAAKKSKAMDRALLKSENWAVSLALGTFYGAKVWALKEQGKRVLSYENGIERMACEPELYMRGMELCKAILADERNLELTKAFSELQAAWFAYWLGKYEEAIVHGKKYLEWKQYFADKEEQLIRQRTALFAADSFDIVMEKQTYAILICANLRMGGTDMLELYFDKLGWQDSHIYLFEDMMPTLAEGMEQIKETAVGKKLLQLMQKNEALWEYYLRIKAFFTQE